MYYLYLSDCNFTKLRYAVQKCPRFTQTSARDNLLNELECSALLLSTRKRLNDKIRLLTAETALLANVGLKLIMNESCLYIH